MGVTACLLRNCLQWPHKRDFLDESDSEVGSYLSSHPTDADCRKFLYNQLSRVLLSGGIWVFGLCLEAFCCIVDNFACMLY